MRLALANAGEIGTTIMINSPKTARISIIRTGVYLKAKKILPEMASLINKGVFLMP